MNIYIHVTGAAIKQDFQIWSHLKSIWQNANFFSPFLAKAENVSNIFLQLQEQKLQIILFIVSMSVTVTAGLSLTG